MSTSVAGAAAAPTLTKATRIWGVTWRWGLTLIGAGCAASILCDAVQAGGNTKINIATSGVAAGALVAFFADLVALYEGCKEFILGSVDSLRSMKSNFWKAWVSATAIGVSVMSWAGPAGPDPWFIVYTNQATPPPPEPRRISAIPALYTNNATKDWSKGVAFNKKELDVSLGAFGRIFAAFEACGSVQAKPQVELTITGYASSSEFKNETGMVSNTLNVEAANRRAWNAYCYMAGRIPVDLLNANDWPNPGWSCGGPAAKANGSRAPIKLRVTRWPESDAGFLAMMQARPIQDWPLELRTRDPVPSEELDRRVDFYLNHAGACQVESSDGAPITVAATTR